MVSDVMALINDNEFKGDFLINIMEGRKKVTQTEAEMAWMGAVDAMKRIEFDCASRNMLCNLASLKHAVMRSAELGLSLHAGAKECYLGFDVESQDGSFKLGFCHRGLRRLLLRNPEVKRFSAQVVHDVDKFEWKGECERPGITITGNSNNIIFAYAWLELKNGDITSVLLNEEDLRNIENMDKDRALQLYGDSSQSMYASVWRKRMFEIEALKALFRQCGDIIEITNNDEAFAPINHIGSMD
ncbi:recombinase RecT [Rheinheimera sp.]|uniref:recombinase RecT n=1 Tax=Rheinheimera sp. TaxID=1869214 RepID=UPI004047F3EF